MQKQKFNPLWHFDPLVPNRNSLKWSRRYKLWIMYKTKVCHLSEWKRISDKNLSDRQLIDNYNNNIKASFLTQESPTSLLYKSVSILFTRLKGYCFSFSIVNWTLIKLLAHNGYTRVSLDYPRILGCLINRRVWWFVVSLFYQKSE